MGVQLRYGTAGATGGGFSSRPGELQPSLDERWHEPKWQWQCRGPKTWADKLRWRSCWSFGCRIGYGAPSGNDGVSSCADISAANPFEPFSCGGEGTQTKRFIRGVTKDSSGNAISDVIVQGFVTATDAYVGQDVSRTDGTYTLGTETIAGVQHYLVAYKPGSPDIGGTTVNTITSTNVDGT